MSRALSSSTERPYGVARVCEEWRVPRSSFYLHRKRGSTPPPPPRKRGPKTEHTDAQLTERIREVISASPFSGEGYRKVWARLRKRGVRAGQPRVLRLMREAWLLAAQRGGGPAAPATTTEPSAPTPRMRCGEPTPPPPPPSATARWRSSWPWTTAPARWWGSMPPAAPTASRPSNPSFRASAPASVASAPPRLPRS